MVSTPKQEIKLFYCYAREDKPLRDELEKHLSWLKRHYQLTDWHDREILPGEDWERAIDTHLNTADLIFLLISPDFMASDYCQSKEMQRALERHKAGTCQVVPILLRPTYWEDAPFSGLQLLPTNARSITRWPDRDEAFQDVVTEISRIIKNLLISLKTGEELVKEGKKLYDLKRYEEALAVYEQAIRLNPDDSIIYFIKGNILRDLKRYEEALAAYEQVIRLNPYYGAIYFDKDSILRDLELPKEALVAYKQAGHLRSHDNAFLAVVEIQNLRKLKRYDEVIVPHEQAIRLNPNNATAYTDKGNALRDLGHYEEALVAYEQAIRLNPNSAAVYTDKGNALRDLRSYEEALVAYEQAIRLNPSSAVAYYGKGHAFRGLKRYEEAEQAFAKARQLTN